VERGLLVDFTLTELGRQELEPYRVRNAVILAAGGSELSPKHIYLRPKGLFKMNGETLVERLTAQLREIGIEEIYIVVGYKKEAYFFLEAKHGVKLLINEQPRLGSIFSLFGARVVLDATYILNCDNYYPKNPFEQYVYDSYYCTVVRDDSDHELGVTTNRDGRITSLTTGKGRRECVYGHAYFSRAFSGRIKSLMDEEIEDFRVDLMFWQEFYAKHIGDLDLYARRYDSQSIFEFDSVQELQAIDEMFIENISADLITIITQELCCSHADISNIKLSNKGLSNILFTFSVFGAEYILRLPGESASIVNDRAKEVVAQKLAGQTVDPTVLYIDQDGIKISRYVTDARDLGGIYYHDIGFMVRLVGRLRELHDTVVSQQEQSLLEFDPLIEADRLMRMACRVKGDLFGEFAQLRSEVVALWHRMAQDAVPKVLTHNDLNISNVLFPPDGSVIIIDWEFAGFNDPAFDFGRILDAYEPDSPEVETILAAYLGHPPAPWELAHYSAGVAIHSWYYFGWCLYKESLNEDTAFYMLYFFQRIRKWMAFANASYTSCDQLIV
jgi:CTP:phosphocholine cytidylyltransferase-like protein/aminoglycoside phosphotransferase (APT) family kinase protein